MSWYRKPDDTGPHAGTVVVDDFAVEMCDELERSQAKFPAPHSLHEAYAVILEEVEEFWDEVRKQTSARDPEAIRHELVQIATMCWRCARDVVPNCKNV